MCLSLKLFDTILEVIKGRNCCSASDSLRTRGSFRWRSCNCSFVDKIRFAPWRTDSKRMYRFCWLRATIPSLQTNLVILVRQIFFAVLYTNCLYTFRILIVNYIFVFRFARDFLMAKCIHPNGVFAKGWSVFIGIAALVNTGLLLVETYMGYSK